MSTEPDDKEQQIASFIDDNLKRVYSDLVPNELPDRFKDLLSILKAQDAKKTPLDGGDDA